MKALSRTPQKGWIHCLHTISPRPRLLKNLMAFSPGARLRITLQMPVFLVKDLESSAVLNRSVATAVPARVQLMHLVSYQHMGVVRISCGRGCTCRAKDVDAHRRELGRNLSIFQETSLDVAFRWQHVHPDQTMKRARCVFVLAA